MAKAKIFLIGKEIYPNKWINILINIVITAIPMIILIGIPFLRVEIDYAMFPLFFITYFIMEYCMVKICDIIMPKIMMITFGLINLFISILLVAFLSDINLFGVIFENYIYLFVFIILFSMIRAILKSSIKQLVLRRIILKKLKGLIKNEKNDSKENGGSPKL